MKAYVEWKEVRATGQSKEHAQRPHSRKDWPSIHHSVSCTSPWDARDDAREHTPVWILFPRKPQRTAPGQESHTHTHPNQ